MICREGEATTLPLSDSNRLCHRFHPVYHQAYPWLASGLDPDADTHTNTDTDTDLDPDSEPNSNPNPWLCSQARPVRWLNGHNTVLHLHEHEQQHPLCGVLKAALLSSRPD